MRLDLFLKVSRLIPRRSLAQEFCDKGLVRVNDSVAKASKAVTEGDRIEIRRGETTAIYRIAKVPASKQVSKASAGDLVEILEADPTDVGS